MTIAISLFGISIVLYYIWAYIFFTKGFPKLSKRNWRLAYLFSPLLFTTYLICLVTEKLYAKFNVGVYCEITYMPDIPSKLTDPLVGLDSNVSAYTLDEDGSLKELTLEEFKEIVNRETKDSGSPTVHKSVDKKTYH